MITVNVSTDKRQDLINITDEVKEAVADSGVIEGICVVYSSHTTGGITLNSQMDPPTLVDLIEEIDRIVPTRVDFKHIFDTPSDASGHIKTSIVGNSTSIPISSGELCLGSSQGILFWEFDGPRKRKVYLQIIGS
tara:strand:- start:22 stop:426 length:405 start_codon:yes stop_codon:yes gene_type:complete